MILMFDCNSAIIPSLRLKTQFNLIFHNAMDGIATSSSLELRTGNQLLYILNTSHPLYIEKERDGD